MSGGGRVVEPPRRATAVGAVEVDVALRVVPAFAHEVTVCRLPARQGKAITR